MSAQNIRSHSSYKPLPEGRSGPPMPVLHCIILRIVGRPMREYSSDLDLLLGFRDSLLGEYSIIIHLQSLHSFIQLTGIYVIKGSSTGIPVQVTPHPTSSESQ
jgi:hypothetical protein